MIESKVSKRSYFWVSLYAIPMMIGFGWISFSKDEGAWPIFIICGCFVSFFIMVFRSMRLSVSSKSIRYKSMFRKVEIDIRDLRAFGVRAAPTSKPIGKPIFYFVEEGGEEYLLPVNMFKEGQVKKMASYLKKRGIVLLSDGKYASNRSIYNFYE